MLGVKNRFLHRVRIFVAVITCTSFVSAQSSIPAGTPQTSSPCNLVDPGPRPAGNTVVYAVPDDHGNTFDNFAQQDQTGVNNSSGNHLLNLTADEVTFWAAGLAIFGDVASVDGAPPGVTSTQPIVGLGPRFNGNSCAMCHSQPAIGGTSPGIGTPLPNGTIFTQNPQIALAKFDNANNNTVPSFVSNRPNGPVVEARFPQTATNGVPNSGLDGAVHDLYTIQGMTGAGNCKISQPLFADAVNNNNVIFRIPTPTFGVGLIETVSDDALVSSSAAALTAATSLNETEALGISGIFNRSGNDQSITRFGWKAQNPSLLMFAGEASNVEMGVTNELFPFERDAPEPNGTDCTQNATPEDFTTATANTTVQVPNVISSNIEALSFFMFANTPPAQCDFGSGESPVTVGGVTTEAPNCNAFTSPVTAGKAAFNTAGCNLCHSPTLTTGPSNFTDLNNAPFHPYSDFAVHHMGAQLADGVTQGAAGPDQFRTAPLWGAGQRLFFMHDGRSSSLVDAIEQHFTPATQCTTVTSPAETFILNGQTITIPSTTTKTCGSEANGVINRFNNTSILSCTQQQDIIDFLRSL